MQSQEDYIAHAMEGREAIITLVDRDLNQKQGITTDAKLRGLHVLEQWASRQKWALILLNRSDTSQMLQWHIENQAYDNLGLFLFSANQDP